MTQDKKPLRQNAIKTKGHNDKMSQTKRHPDKISQEKNATYTKCLITKGPLDKMSHDKRPSR